MSIKHRVRKLERDANNTFVVGWLRYYDANGCRTYFCNDTVETAHINDTVMQRDDGEASDAFEARVHDIAKNELGATVCVTLAPGDENL